MAIEAGSSLEAEQKLAIYPLGDEVVRTVVRPLFQNLNSTWQEYLMLKERVHDEENTYANGYLMAVGENFTGEANEGFRIGVALSYDILREKIGKEKVPVLNLEYVQAYDMYMGDRLRKVYGRDLEKQIAGADNEELIKRGLFTLIEREAYEALDEEMTEANESIFENYIFLGFVISYFLFRRGLSNPRYWEAPMVGSD